MYNIYIYIDIYMYDIYIYKYKYKYKYLYIYTGFHIIYVFVSMYNMGYFQHLRFLGCTYSLDHCLSHHGGFRQRLARERENGDMIRYDTYITHTHVYVYIYISI